MSRAVHHHLDIYGAELYFCRTAREWQKLRRSINSLDEEPGGIGHTSIDIDGETNAYAVTIYVHPHLSARDTAETVAHEASHAGRMILNHIGETATTHECEAYLVGWIAGWITDNLRPSQ